MWRPRVVPAVGARRLAARADVRSRRAPAPRPPPPARSPPLQRPALVPPSPMPCLLLIRSRGSCPRERTIRQPVGLPGRFRGAPDRRRRSSPAARSGAPPAARGSPRRRPPGGRARRRRPRPRGPASRTASIACTRRAAGRDDVLDDQAALAGLQRRPLDAALQPVRLGLLAHEERLDVGAAGERGARGRVGAHRQPADRGRVPARARGRRRARPARRSRPGAGSRAWRRRSTARCARRSA